LPKFLIPTVPENLAGRGSIKFTILVIAAWCCYSDKVLDKNGQSLEIIDAMSSVLLQVS
tara:strand:+ start:266 stop:442 length:177 start_codon:yes stop_codon:yes gene_type:complete